MTNHGELSPIDHEIAYALQQKKRDYYFIGPDNYSELSNKTAIGIIGPIGIGKKRLSRAVSAAYPDIGQLGMRLTRPSYPNDPPGFKTAEHGVTHSSLSDDVINGKLVTFSVDSNHHIRGMLPEDFNGDVSVGPIPSDCVDSLFMAGLRDFYPVFVVARGGLYERSLLRLQTDTKTLRPRLIEGLGSLGFARLNIEEPWLNFVEMGDNDQELHTAVEHIHDITYKRTHPSMTPSRKLQFITEMQTAIQNVNRQLS